MSLEKPHAERRWLAELVSPNNWPLIFIPVLLLIVGRFAAPNLGLASFNSVTHFASPYLATLEPGSAGQPLTSHVVLVLVDGLRVDASRQMSTLNGLRAQGADRVLTAGVPSLSYPGAAVIASGGWQEQNGVAFNAISGAKVDSIFHAAKRQGLTTSVVGGESWKQLFSAGVDDFAFLKEPADRETNMASIAPYVEANTSLALNAIKADPNLLIIHYGATDWAGHGWGGASPEYAEAAQIVDRSLAKIVAAVDLKETTFFVMSDHGQIDTGGHGGADPAAIRVPFVAAGKAIKAGQYGDAFQVDVAPTLAVLLGTSFPAHSQGEALLDQVEAPASLKAARAVDNAKEVATRYDSMLGVLGRPAVERGSLQKAESALQAANYTDAITAAGQTIDSAYAAWQPAVDARVNSERLIRLVLALVILIPSALYLYWWKRTGWNWLVPVVGAAIYFILFNFNFFLVKGLYYSLSAFNSEELIPAFLTARVTEAMIVLVLAAVIVGVLSARERAGEVIRRVVNMMFLVATGLIVQILLFFVLYNLIFNWHLPDFTWGFKAYMDIFQMTMFYPLPYLPIAAIVPFLAAAVALLARIVLNVVGWVPRTGPATA